MRRMIFLIATILESTIVISLSIYLAYLFKLDPIVLLSCIMGYYIAAKNGARRQLDE
jgi:hypothetical protein